MSSVTSGAVAHKPLVLFLCAHNACRSQLAEAILRSRAGDRFDVASAGLEPTTVHPFTLRVLEERGIPTAGLHAKSAAGFLGKAAVRYAIIVCASTQDACPRIYPLSGETLSWPFEDPAAATGSDEERLQVFRRVRDQIAERIDQWLARTNEG